MIFWMWLSDAENRLSIGSLVQKIKDAEKRHGRSGRSTWENSHIQRKLARPSASLVINRFRRVKYHRPPIGRCVHRQSFILHEKLIHLGNFDFEAENFEKEKKMLTTLGIFNIFKILKIRDDSFVALLILRHVIYDN